METVTVYDPESRVYTDIPEAELAPGMVRAKVEGREGEVWIEPSKLKQAEYQHPPFEGATRDQIVAIQNSFSGVYEKSYEFWEDGFRRDTNPDSEIAVWLRISEVYRRHGEDKPQAFREDLFSLVIACSNSDPQRIEIVFEPKVLSQEEVRSISSDYFTS